MKRLQIKNWSVLGLMILFLALPTGAAAQTALSGIVTFGASLSDPGNAFALTAQQSMTPYSTLNPLLIPGSPYAKGGHHFSNGSTWIEQLAKPLGFSAYALPAFNSNGSKAANYAIGGARARAVAGGASFSDEVSAFLKDSGNVAPSDALYVLEFGGNDIRDALAAGDPETINAIIGSALEAISSNIQLLYGAGARYFFVWNVPDLGMTPAVRMLGPGACMYAQIFCHSFNAGLDAYLSQLAALPDIKIISFDANGVLQSLIDDPESFGLSVVDEACVTPDHPPYECKTPDTYLFWDGIHPTKAVHAILAQIAMLALAQL
jgi:phospholipase/lecithinase/hemolysin